MFSLWLSGIFPFFFSSFCRTAAFLPVNLASYAPSTKLFVTILVTVVCIDTSKLVSMLGTVSIVGAATLRSLQAWSQKLGNYLCQHHL